MLKEKRNIYDYRKGEKDNMGNLLRFTKKKAEYIIKEHKKFFGDNYKKVKTGKNEYKLIKKKKRRKR